ncbi:MAG: Methyltransferase type 12 [Herbaspirillum sp.]|nr:Methyltransferase type 12 [Herbaspirillum sp.]
MNSASPADESLESAIRHHLAGRHAAAEALYRRIIAAQPALAAPKHWLGFMLQQIDRLEEAHELMSESLRLDDTHADWHYNFAILLARLEKTDLAVQSFLNAIALQPQNYFSWTNLGALYEKSADYVKAEQSYLLAAKLDPDCPDAYYLLSALYVEQERFKEAKQFHCLGFTSGPIADKSRIKLSLAYYELGRVDEAIALIDGWLAEQPDHPEAQHLAIAYKGLPAPQRCPDAYVESTYDGFAASFETTLSKLKYAGPEALTEELQGMAIAGAVLETLDLGCGTGLNGGYLKAVSSTLTGVDLSERMLDQARQKAVYDRLIKSEICAFLADSKQQYDLITCMDTLIYFGALEEIMMLMARNLKPGGAIIFTTETPAADDGTQPSHGSGRRDYHLNISGRYSHPEAYLRHLLQSNGFAQPHLRDMTIRMEAGTPIAGQMLRAYKL